MDKLTEEQLNNKTLNDLRELAKMFKELTGYKGGLSLLKRKSDLVEFILSAQEQLSASQASTAAKGKAGGSAVQAELDAGDKVAEDIKKDVAEKRQSQDRVRKGRGGRDLPVRFVEAAEPQDGENAEVAVVEKGEERGRKRREWETRVEANEGDDMPVARRGRRGERVEREERNEERRNRRGERDEERRGRRLDREERPEEERRSRRRERDDERLDYRRRNLVEPEDDGGRYRREDDYLEEALDPEERAEELNARSMYRGTEARGRRNSRLDLDDYDRDYDSDYQREERMPRRSERYRDDYEDEEYEEEKQPVPFVSGVLELRSDGNGGMLRGVTFKPCDNDVYVPMPVIKSNNLRCGDMVTGIIGRAPKHGEGNFASMSRVVSVNGMDPEAAKKRPIFDQMVPIFPDEQFKLEFMPTELSTRIIDIFCPIGKGQRALIVSPPKAGKTMMLKNIARGIVANAPEVVLMALLVDERPEEVTDMERSIRGQVIASTFDESSEQHIRISNLTLERARRLVELGKDVVIILDSLTRLGRACNNAAPNSGRTMTGGLDISALHVPKRLFGSARNIENGGSLTIIATALIETNSKMDEVIFEEFKGTGNMEVNLSRKLAENRIYPAIDVRKSGTRHDEKLLSPDMMNKVTAMRHRLSTAFAGEKEYAQVELVIKSMLPHKTNEEFLGGARTNNAQ